MDEIRCYLQMLLQHECDTGTDNCPECRVLMRIKEFLETAIFSTVIYTDWHPDSGRPALPKPMPANRAARRA